MKTCTKCFQDKPESDFPLKPSGEPRPQCKECRNAYMRGYYQKNKELHKGRVYSNPNRSLNKRRHEARTYGFQTLEEYEAFLNTQPEMCPICEKRVAIFTDHSHETGKARGRLCPQCNFLLGNAEDDIEILQKAIAYLKRS